MLNDAQALELVRAALNELGNEMGKTELLNADPGLRLLGASSPIDSMGLVSLIADLEGRIATTCNKEVVLADDTAMSAMRSPFRTVGALATHVRNLVDAAP